MLIVLERKQTIKKTTEEDQQWYKSDPKQQLVLRNTKSQMRNLYEHQLENQRWTLQSRVDNDKKHEKNKIKTHSVKNKIQIFREKLTLLKRK